MDDKLLRFFSVINLDKKYYPYFKGSRVKKVVVDKEKKEWTIYLYLIDLINVSVFEQLYECSKSIDDVKKVHFVFSFEDDKNLLLDYYKYYFDILVRACPMLESMKDNKIKIENNIISIDVLNIAEDKKIKSLKKKIVLFLNNMGFKDVDLVTFINEEERKNLKEMISNESTQEIKIVKPKLIFGSPIKGDSTKISNIFSEEANIVIDAYVFNIDIKNIQNKFTLVTFKISDKTDSIYAKMFLKNLVDIKTIKENIVLNNWYKFSGYVSNDSYTNELVLNIRNIEFLDVKNMERIDNYPTKRVELQTHTWMSAMDGCVEPSKLVKQAYKWGHRGIAITDHNGCQAFPEVYKTVKKINSSLKEGEEPFKAIYGTELLLIDDSINIVLRSKDLPLLDTAYVVFDFETTGLNAGGGDTIIEIGAVKIQNGEVIDRFNELIDPGHKLNTKITEITGITDSILKGKDDEENVIKKFAKWFGDSPMVAHNAKFDLSFLEKYYNKYNLGEFKNTVIDTLELSRTLDNSYGKHSLSALVKRYDVAWDEESHHRADYDAEGTALVFNKMLHKLKNQGYELISELNNLVPKNEIHKYGRSYHVNILATNKVGLKNLFKIISYANTKYLYKTPRILRSEIENNREGLLIGSSCYESEVFIEARSKGEEELTNILNFYDYVEIQPISCYSHLVESGEFANSAELIEHIKKIIKVTNEAGKLLVASGDVHHLNEEDKITREIIVNQKIPGGGFHPLARHNIKNIPSMHFRTTDEMMKEFEFLTTEEREKIVIRNPNKILDMCEIIEVIIETGGVPFSPKIDNSIETVTNLVYEKATSWYGNPLPSNIEERIAKELYGDNIISCFKDFKLLHQTINKGMDAVKQAIASNTTFEENIIEEEKNKIIKKKMGGIIGGGFDVIYLIAQKLVKHSNDEGFLVGSRGSVGSSFVATLMGITEVNPLPAHYRCLHCQYSEFNDSVNEPLSKKYASGFDLPDKECPICGEKLYKDGQDMPFATFLGFNADKVPDIDLNFSDLNQSSAHEYTKVLFGKDNVYRAGTIGTVADKTAFGFVKGYCEDKGILKRKAEIERLAIGVTGIKRTTGQHPGGIVVIPKYMDVFDFTPYQYPADDPESLWKTTHFDYHSIEEDVLKLDILGHSDPTQLKYLQELSGLDVTKIPFDDKETMSIFLSPKALGVTKEQIMCETGTLGVPEFGTPFTIGMLTDTKPTTFSELVKISGLSHGTDVWLGNAQELIKNNVVPFKEVIGCRDDIMVYLMNKGLEPIKAFKIMEFVRKGKPSQDPETWNMHKQTMRDAGIEGWYIGSCEKIKYMFPKAHAAAYVISAFRIAWFKVHKPAMYYASQFTAKITDYDIDAMIGGYNKIKEKISEISGKGYNATNKELSILETLKIALEATARKINFMPINLNKSGATDFKLKDDNNLYPPFSTIDGLGDTVAKTIVSEREKRPFISIEDLQNRGKVSSTLIDKMKVMGILEELPESSQMSLFNF